MIRSLRLCSVLLALLCLAGAAAAQAPSGSVSITVLGSNGQPIAAALVTLEQNGKAILRERTSAAGTMSFQGLRPGSYHLVVERDAFYPVILDKVEVVSGQKLPVEVRLQAVREYREEVEVVARPSPIDPEQTTAAQSITREDITNIPYPSTRDYRNVLPFIPGVLADSSGQIHVGGSSTQEIQDYIDGFEVSQPASGSLGVRMNPDALRRIEVRSSRYSAQFGKGSGGLTDIEVQDGDNRLRYNATDFFPTFQNVKGFHLNNWTPRAYVSGPIIRNKAWFDVAHEGENDVLIVKQLPDGADSSTTWRTSDLGRLRMNLAPGNVLTATGLLDLFNGEHFNLSPFDPVSTTFNVHQSLYFTGLKDQITVAKDTLLEFGAGFHRTKNVNPTMGDQPWILRPSIHLGNYYLHSENISDRSQAFANLYLRPWKFLGAHQFTLGGRVDRIVFHGDNLRQPVLIQDDNGVPLRTINFSNISAPFFSLSTLESSAYLQDRWLPSARTVIEAGARWDRDSFVNRDVFSPRIAGTVLLAKASETKITAGIGIYYDRSNLSLFSQSVQGSRSDAQLFAPVPFTIFSAFTANPAQLPLPRFVNWSAGIERRLPWSIYGRIDYLKKTGNGIWAYELQPDGSYILQGRRQDRYDGVQLTVRKELKRGYPFAFSYTRSHARTNEAIDFSIDNFTSGPQLGGPMVWDAPNQVTSWGSYPLPSFWKFRKFDFYFSALWRSGYPFVTINQFNQLVQGPGAHRFPDFLTLNPAIEKKFNFHGYRWAARAAIENVTGSTNPEVVDNNINSPTFLTFFGLGHRTFNGRIRFLGRQ
ncbi:MAG TPA: carboxypeptidase regulatory-like domain-containing protein [Candidatus Limnocylindrales bacterium]|nr:carboxypeptidase regulatory-like domain-containing protein [Candidatus Limnocylindrales bacterium]